MITHGGLFMKRITTLTIAAAAAVAAFTMPLSASAFGVAIDLEPSKYQRHVACNEAWRASHAHKVQGCKLRSVHWDSYHTGGYGIFYMRRSNCWIHIECEKGHPVYPKGVHNGKVPYTSVFWLRRCKDDAGKVGTSCEALTQQHIDEALANHEEQHSLWGDIIAKWLEQNGNQW